MNSTPISSSTSPTGTTGSGAHAPANPSGTLGKDDFLKLMVAQLKSQDPLQPTNDSAYIGQLAQFTELEQITNLAQNSSQSTSTQQVAQAVQLIGHSVSYLDSSGATRQGTVKSVEVGSSGPTLTIEDAAGVNPGSIRKVS